MKLGLVFSHGVSLKTWREQGIFDREVAPYLALLRKQPNIQIVFFTYDDFSVGAPEGIGMVAMGKSVSWAPAFLRPLASLALPILHFADFNQCNVLKTNQIWGSWVAVLASIICHCKLWTRVGYEHYLNHLLRQSPFYKRWPSYWVSLFGYQFADLVTVTTVSMASFIERHFMVGPENVTVHGNYIDTTVFAPRLVEVRRRALYVGRLNRHKNVEALLDACASLSLPLTVVGQGEERERLGARALELGLDCDFIPSVPNHELPDFYAGHMVFCLPSLFEGNPKVLLEAMGCGATVVGCNVKGINEVIDHGENGLLCGTDAHSLGVAIQTLLDDGPLREKLRAGARRKIERHFSFESYLAFERANLARLAR